MTTSQETSLLFKPKSGEAIPLSTIAYFQARNRNRVHSLVLKMLREEGISQAEVARRINKAPEVVCRLIGAPGNWTLDTVSDLLFAISGCEIEYDTSNPFDAPPTNYTDPEWLTPKPDLLDFAQEPKSKTGTSNVQLEIIE